MTQEEHDAYQSSWRKQWDDFCDALSQSIGASMFGFVLIALLIVGAIAGLKVG
jgi:hypothetical protein